MTCRARGRTRRVGWRIDWLIVCTCALRHRCGRCMCEGEGRIDCSERRRTGDHMHERRRGAYAACRNACGGVQYVCGRRFQCLLVHGATWSGLPIESARGARSRKLAPTCCAVLRASCVAHLERRSTDGRSESGDLSLSEETPGRVDFGGTRHTARSGRGCGP